MADAINSGNPVDTTQFIVNKYHDIDGKRVNQQTARGRFCFIDSNGRMTLPRDLTEARKAVFPVDWPKPLNPGPYFAGPGLNGAQVNGLNDGSLDNQEGAYTLDPDQMYVSNWPTGVTQYDLPLHLYGLPVASGNKALAFDGGTFTFGSGAYVGLSSAYTRGTPVFVDYTAGNEGKLTVSGAAASNTVVGRVLDKDVFGQNTITVKLKGLAAL
jgi:hypothetical protein